MPQWSTIKNGNMAKRGHKLKDLCDWWTVELNDVKRGSAGAGVKKNSHPSCQETNLLTISLNGPVSSRDNRVLKGPLGRSLRSFARTAHSAHSLRSAPLRYARFAHSLRSQARSLTSLTPSWDSWYPWICVHAEIAIYGNKHDSRHHWKRTLNERSVTNAPMKDMKKIKLNQFEWDGKFHA